MLKYSFALFLCFITAIASSQSIFKGRVYEDKTHVVLTDIQVLNLNTKKLTLTDNRGKFSIAATVGDLLVFKGFVYLPDTLMVINLLEKEVFLIPKPNQLLGVNVNVNYTPNLDNYYDPEFHGQTMVYQRDKDMNFKGGVIFRLWYWKKDEKKRVRREKVAQDDAIRDQITTAFKPANVAKYVPLKGKDLDDFIVLYTPEANVFLNPDFRMTTYLNDCYKKYQKLDSLERHPKPLEKLP